MELMYLCRHQAGCDLLSALTEWRGRKYKPGVWQVKVFPSLTENVQCLENTPATLLSLISRSLPAQPTAHPDPHPMSPGLEHCLRQRHTRHSGLSFSVNRRMGVVNTQSRSISLCAIQPPSPQAEATSQQAGMMFKSLTGRAGIPRSQFPAPAFGVSENKVVLMMDCFTAECKREAAGGGPQQLNTAPEPYLHSAMQQCRWLLVETTVSCRKKPLAPEQGVLWSWNGLGTCQISHHLLFQKS